MAVLQRFCKTCAIFKWYANADNQLLPHHQRRISPIQSNGSEVVEKLICTGLAYEKIAQVVRVGEAPLLLLGGPAQYLAIF